VLKESLKTIALAVAIHNRLTSRLTYRRRRWSAKMIHKLARSAERKARAAVRCRRIVRLHFVRVSEFVWPPDSQTSSRPSRAKILNTSVLPLATRLVVPHD